MTVKELKDELDCYDEDMDVVFELDDDVYVDRWSEDKYGMKKVWLSVNLKPTFISTLNGTCNIEMGIDS